MQSAYDLDCVEIGFKLGTEKFGENVIRRTGLLFRARLFNCRPYRIGLFLGNLTAP